MRYSNFLLPKIRRIQSPPANAPRLELESFKLSQLLEMPQDSVMKMLERLLARQKTEWESFMTFPDPEFISINWEHEA